MQIGAPPAAWPLALAKELNDNALDACESAGIPPEITITLTDDSVTVVDNGPGLPWETLKGSLDYLVRVSDKSSYVSPMRGQLGNALKCIWAAAFVADGTRGRVDVSTGGMVYQIDVSLDRIAQQPRLQITTTEDDSVKTGTAITMFWKRIACYLSVDAHADFYRPIPMDLGVLITRYALCNPHATFTYLPQESADAHISRATHAAWKKWLPSAPTSPHWYDDAKFQQLLLAYLRLDRARNRSRPVRRSWRNLTDYRGQRYARRS
jgi:DNA topoisomerase VI subunit B